MPELEDDPSQVHNPCKSIQLIQFDWFHWRANHPEIFLSRSGEDGSPSDWKALIAETGVERVNTALFNIKKVAPKGNKVYLADVLIAICSLSSTDSSHNSDSDAKSHHWLLDKPCWMNYCKDLIYAAAWGSVCYVGEVERRRTLDAKSRTHALINGEHLCKWVTESFTGASGLHKARQACGDDTSVGSKRRFKTTLIICRDWLPPSPGAKA